MVRDTPANAGDTREAGSIPGLGRSPGGGCGNPLQYSCLENPMDRGACGLQSIGLQRVDTTVHMHSRFRNQLACPPNIPMEW